MRRVYVNGSERPFVHGQTVTLLAFLDGRQFEKRTVPLRYAGGKEGKFSTTLRVPGSGRVSVLVQHRANDEMKGFRRTAARLSSLDENVGPGATGPVVKLIQQRLAALHFYMPQTGVFDNGTALAIDAYHRLLGWGVSETVDPATIKALLNGQGSFTVRHPDQGEHAEGDLSDQLLALVDGSQVKMIFPISSGKPSTPTILGSYRVYRADAQDYLPDGMYYSDFFIRGYAIHGYDPAPDYPASHGCMRLPIQDAIPAFDWLKLGDWVDTYYT